MSIFLSFPENQLLAGKLSHILNWPVGQWTWKSFPDGETYVRCESNVKDQDVAIVCSLDHPNEKIIPLIFLAKTVKELGAKRVGLIVPYLAYMRQDSRFNPGEGISAKYFAEMLSQNFDWLITVEPHLHRFYSMSEVYSIPSEVVQVGSVMAQWIQQNVKHPFLIGPDGESQQWVEEVAHAIDVPYVVATKVRHSAHEVEITLPAIPKGKDYVPVLVDDMISTGNTLINISGLLKKNFDQAPVVVAVHGLFVEAAYDRLLQNGISSVVTCNTVPHQSNVMDISELVAEKTKRMVMRWTHPFFPIE